MMNFIKEHEVPCPSCGKHNFTDIRQFNLMFKTFQGVTEDAKNTVYFKTRNSTGYLCKLQKMSRELPVKRFHLVLDRLVNLFVMRSHRVISLSVHVKFEQMELEFFCEPDTDLEWFAYWKKFCLDWLSSLGLKDDEVRYRDHDKEELTSTVKQPQM